MEDASIAGASGALTLGFGLQFTDLYDRAGLERLDRAFLAFLKNADEELQGRLVQARLQGNVPDRKAQSQLLLELVAHLEDFIGDLFKIAVAVQSLRARHDELAALHTVKRSFVQRRATKGKSAEEAATIDGASIARELARLLGEPLTELAFAHGVTKWLEAEAEHREALDLAARYALWAVLSEAGRREHGGGILFKLPHKVDRANLVALRETTKHGVTVLAGADDRRQHRDGFKVTDRGASFAQALDHANYCIWCHNQEKDSCSKGLRDRKTGACENDAFGVKLLGCPLEQRISEMNLARSRGYVIGALAIVTIDNPLCAATGHRICNDCMKACIFQKQEPVDVPQVESRTLRDVMALPWGFEIYSLLTRWNPLNVERPIPRPATGRNVLVVGLGPAGFTLAHHLLNDGHMVVGVDGLKIEPLAPALAGIDLSGRRVPFVPIRHIADVHEELDQRMMAGFGGVAEYGITVRWDKNNLKIVRLLLERRAAFAMYGGVRFGGALTIDDAFARGFDHVALCLGAGRPTFVAMKNGLAPGVRQASDFLMALQLTGAAKADSIANLTVRLPIVVIGGGLTAIDTATEALAYYPVQVEKFLARYERLQAERGDGVIQWAENEISIANEFMLHARALRNERAAAAKEGRLPQLSGLLESWGGVTVIYRRGLRESPSYTLNHEEVAKAMEEGITFAEYLAPQAVELDANGHAEALTLRRTDALAGDATQAQAIVTLPARTILVAAGTQPNTVLEREDPLHLKLDGKYFQAIDQDGRPVSPERNAKPASADVLMSRRADGRSVSFFGDLHPSFAGNVVKAMASATRGYRVITRSLEAVPPAATSESALAKVLDHDLRATVHDVRRLTPTIIELILHAPAAARAFRPGQFFRLQNYEAIAPKVKDTRLATEGLALTGASVDREKGLVSTIVLEMGGSSNLCALFQRGDPVVLMGPSGTPTEIASGRTYVLAGGGLGNAVLFSIGQAAKAEGSKVLYFAAYKRLQDRFKVEQIERAADTVVWCSEEPPGFAPGRPQDRAFAGNIVDAMQAYAKGLLGAPPIKLNEAERLIAIGSDAMMAAIARARSGLLRPYLHPRHEAVASINSPMQCMMKEICGQCLQLHRDPFTQEETTVFSCAGQDQRLDLVDFATLRGRLRQNAVQERLTKHWIDFVLSGETAAEVTGTAGSGL
jgi:NADPH-dependent glutamate synthase beta subunit-like oxidoreductase/NAD(P)H-flavin reductase